MGIMSEAVQCSHFDSYSSLTCAAKNGLREVYGEPLAEDLQAQIFDQGPEEKLWGGSRLRREWISVDPVTEAWLVSSLGAPCQL